MKKKLSAMILVGILTLFCVFSGSGCLAGKKKVRFLCPDGAPAIAVYALKDEKLAMTVYPSSVAVDKIGKSLGKKEADLAILPLTAASKLAEKNGYSLVGVVTHGNLYGMGTAANSPADLKGKRVGVMQLGAVPGYTFRAVLTRYGVPFVTDESEHTAENVYLYAISSADEAKAAVDGGLADCCLVAEPAASGLEKKGMTRSFDLQSWYGGGFPQAVLVASKSFLRTEKELVLRLISRLQQQDAESLNAQQVVDFIQSKAEGGTSLKASALTPTALAGCHIRYESAWGMKEKINEYLTAVKAFDTPLGTVAELIPESAYWEGV